MLRPASRLVARLSVALFLALGVATCGGGDGGGGGMGPVDVARVDVSPSQATIDVGGTQQFTVTARDADGNALAGRGVSWSVQSQSVATIASGSGLATGVGEGSTTVTATVEGVQGTAQLTVELGDFAPTSNTSISGDLTFASVSVPAGVTVTVTGPVVITVEGDAVIDGTFTGDCHAIEFRVEGDFTLDGLLSNVCSADPGGAGGGLTVVADGDMTIGSAVSADEAIASDGTVFLTDSALEDASLEPVFDSEAVPVAASMDAARPAQQAGGRNTTVNRPIRAKRGGSEVRVARTGDLDINADVEAKSNGADGGLMTDPTNCVNNVIGGRGGSVRLAAGNGTLTIAANVTLSAGDGGRGGDCTAMAPAGQSATATGGMGGTGGSVLVGGNMVQFGAGVTIARGNGGPGGEAIAEGGDGAAPCEDGFDGTATGGVGGKAGGVGYIIDSPNTIGGTPTETGANGGKGGYAEATGGDGVDCACNVGDGVGGDGGAATANGGTGGDGARGKIWTIGANSHKKGEGGDADALGGDGGDGADCCEEGLPGGDGGAGGAATAIGGQMGNRGIGGDSQRGDADSLGGEGGDGGDGVGTAGAGGAGGVATADGNNPFHLDGSDGDPGELCPQLFGAFLFTAVNTPVTVNAQFIDGGFDLPDAATFMVVGLDPSVGTVTNVRITDVPVPLAGHFVTFEFNPADGFSGTANFQIKVSDETGSQSNLANVTVIVSDFLKTLMILSTGVNTTPGVSSELPLQDTGTSQNVGSMLVVGQGPVFQSDSPNPGPRFGIGPGGIWYFDLWSLSVPTDPGASVRAVQLCFVNLFGISVANPIAIYLLGDSFGSTPPSGPIAAQSGTDESFAVTDETCGGKLEVKAEHRWLGIGLPGASGGGDFTNPYFITEIDETAG